MNCLLIRSLFCLAIVTASASAEWLPVDFADASVEKVDLLAPVDGGVLILARWAVPRLWNGSSVESHGFVVEVDLRDRSATTSIFGWTDAEYDRLTDRTIYEANVVRWDGQSFVDAALPEELVSGSIVGGITAWDGQPVVALVQSQDLFDPSPTHLRGVFKWDGQEWIDLADDPTYPYYGHSGTVAVHDDVLWSSGQFSVDGTYDLPSRRRVVTFDGTTWSYPSAQPDFIPRQFFVLDDQLHAVYAHVDRTYRISRMEPEGWVDLPGAFDGEILAAVAIDGRWVVGGRFTSIDGVGFGRIAAWDGESWTDVDGGTDGVVCDLVVVDDRVLVGGHFETAGGQPLRYLAVWRPEAEVEVPASSFGRFKRGLGGQ